MKTTLLFLICLLAQSFSLPVRAFDYVLSLEGSGTVDENLLPQALYVDETYLYYGFFTAWTEQPGNPEVCGGGLPYLYFTDGGSDRGDAYASDYGEGVAGPSAYIDNANGIIRFYQFNDLTPGNYEPLRIGFRLLQTGHTTLSVDSQAGLIDYWWCDFDTTASFDFTLGQNLPHDFIELALILEEIVTQDIQVSDAVRHSYLAHIGKLLRFFEKGLTNAPLNQVQILIIKVEKDFAQGGISLSDSQAILDIANLMIELIEVP
jgi:hypothetical protein